MFMYFSKEVRYRGENCFYAYASGIKVSKNSYNINKGERGVNIGHLELQGY